VFKSKVTGTRPSFQGGEHLKYQRNFDNTIFDLLYCKLFCFQWSCQCNIK